VRAEIMAAWSGEDDVTVPLMRLDRDQRRALSRRRLAIHDFTAGCEVSKPKIAT
jgi:hypothetical protein